MTFANWSSASEKFRVGVIRFFMGILSAGVEKVSDHGTIGPRKYFGSQKEKDQTQEGAVQSTKILKRKN